LRLKFLRYILAVFKKLKRSGVQTISLSRRWRAVGEDVALVAAAAGATDLDAAHSVGIVFDIC
jgi:ribulose 1,5-bisphosphate carboxylase large subunit-like protein